MLLPAAGLAIGVLADRCAPLTMGEAAALAAAAVLWAWVANGWRRKTAVVVACAGLGAGSAAIHRPGPTPRIDAAASETVILSGCVVEPSILSEDRSQFTLELAPGARARVALYTRPGEVPAQVGYGERVEFEGRIRAPHNFGNPGAFDRETYLARRQIYWNASGRAGGELKRLEGRCGNALDAWLFGLRGEALRRLERFYPGDPATAILMQAVLTGENSRLERSWTEHFRQTGTYHALVISGLHLTVLAGYLLWLLRYTSGRPVAALVLAFGAAWVYAGASGMAAPVTRAAGGFTLFVLGRYWYRATHVLNALAVVVFVFLLADPGQLFEGSFQLSALSVLAIGALAAPLLEAYSRPMAAGFRDLSRDRGDPDLPFWIASLRVEARLIAQTIAIWIRVPERHATLAVEWAGRILVPFVEIFLLSAVVQIALALPMALFFHRVSFTGLVANVVIVPLMNAVVVVGFVAVVTGATPLAWVAGKLLLVARAAADLFAAWEPAWRIPDPPIWLAFGLTAALLGLAIVARRPGRLRWGLAGIVLALFGVLLAHPFAAVWRRGWLEIAVIDVGQGDSTLVVAPDGRTLVIDGGGIPRFRDRGGPRLDMGEDVVSPYLWTRSFRRLDVVALTHAHEDHAGGLAALIRNFQPRELWVGAMGDSPAWARVREAAKEAGVRIVPRTAGESFAFGGARVDVLAPAPDYVPGPAPQNNDSLAMRISLGSQRFLLTGDAEREVEWAMAGAGNLGPVRLLKLGHHGSRTSTTEEFLAAARPAFAIASAGIDNLYRHPHPDVLERLNRYSVRLLRTDRHGLVRILTDGHRLLAETHRGAW